MPGWQLSQEWWQFSQEYAITNPPVLLMLFLVGFVISILIKEKEYGKKLSIFNGRIIW